MPELNCVLLIDDDSATNTYHQIVMDRLGISNHIQICINGKDALNYLTNQGDYIDKTNLPKPDLIFLDINMPGMNGFDFLDEYQSLPEEQKEEYVIIMLTTSLNEEDELKAKAYTTVSDFLNKPLRKDILGDIVQKYFTS